MTASVASLISASPGVGVGISAGAGASGLFCRVLRLRFDIADLAVLPARDGIGATALGGIAGFGGPGAMGTTPLVRAAGVVIDDVVDLGDSES